MANRLPLLLLLALPVGGCDASAETDGCLEVSSPNAWVDGPAPRFVELWRAGGTNEGEELAMPISVAVSPEGRLAITDMRLGVIGVGEDGGWHGTLGRRGEGPGEIGMAAATAWTEDGHLTVLDLRAGKVVRLDLAQPLPAGLLGEDRLDPGALAPIISGGQVAGLGLGADGTALLQDNRPRRDRAEVDQVLMRLAPDGSPADTVAVATAPSLGGEDSPARGIVAVGFPRLAFGVGVDGRVATAGLDETYHIRVSDPEGNETLVCRRASGLPLRADEKGEDLDDGDPFFPLIRESRVSTRPAPIGRLFFGREGRLWVERERPSPAAPIESVLGRQGSLYDVFDREGGYLGEVRAPLGARLMAASGDRVWALEHGAFDVTWVVAYELAAG